MSEQAEPISSGQPSIATSVTVAIDTLQLWDKNPRSIKTERFNELKDRLKRQGQIKPLLVAKNGTTVIGGNMRLRAMSELGIEQVWISQTDAVTDKEIFDLALTDNEEFGYYEKEQVAELALELGLSPLELKSYALSLGTPTTLDLILDQFAPDDIEEDEAPELDETNPPVSEPGAVYQLGPHRLLCGSATDLDAVEQLMDGKKATMIFTDPPYNVAVQGGKHGDPGRTNGLKIENDSMSDADFYQFLYDAHATMAAVTRAGGSIYVCHADSEGLNFRKALVDSGFLLKQCIIWVKQSMVMGRQDYQSQHEPILYGWKDGASHYFVDDRKQTTVWNIDRPSRNAEHPTMKPIALCARAIKNSSHKGDIVIDFFGGSGSTLIAAEETGRVCYMAELDPRYADVIRKRYHKYINDGDEEGWIENTPQIEGTPASREATKAAV